MRVYTDPQPAKCDWTCDRCGAKETTSFGSTDYKGYPTEPMLWNTLRIDNLTIPPSDKHLCAECSKEVVESKPIEWRKTSFPLLELTEAEAAAVHEFVICERRKKRDALMADVCNVDKLYAEAIQANEPPAVPAYVPKVGDRVKVDGFSGVFRISAIEGNNVFFEALDKDDCYLGKCRLDQVKPDTEVPF